MLTAISISDIPDASRLWQGMVDASADGWIWHTWIAHEFNFEAGREYGARDLSFFVYDGGRPVGVVPLIVEERRGRLQAAYYSGFLPWPAFAGSGEREFFEDFAFTELERRAWEAGARSVRMCLTPPLMGPEDEVRVRRAATTYGYEAFSVGSHLAVLDGEWRARVRDRYRRYVKKYAPLFELSVAEGPAVTPQLEEEYFRLHVSDAGKQVRSRQSYARQADTARKGEGFYAVARERTSGACAGMLLVSLYKGVAFDNSVGIDPAFAQYRVGHLLRMFAMEELERRGVSVFELPLKVREGEGASEKERGISHFKEGWTGGASRTIWGMRKEL